MSQNNNLDYGLKSGNNGDIMIQIILLTMKCIFRDRVFHGIMLAAILFLGIPQISSLSMRQVTELSITLALSLFTFILSVLAVFLGATSLWRDIERRYVNSILSLPLHRYEYVFGRFLGISMFISLVGIVLIVFIMGDTWIAMGIYPPSKPVIWANIMIAAAYEIMKSILVVSLALLISSVSTSFFLPIFGVISLYFIGSASQDVHEFLQAGGASVKNLPPLIVKAADFLYYILPNLGSFDFKLHAIYGLAIPSRALALTGAYFLIYTAIIVILSAVVFSRREMK